MDDTSVIPEGVQLDDLLDRLRYLSWGAADILVAYARGEQPPYGFPGKLSVEESEDGPVSAADLAVNTWLIKGLESSFPNVDWGVLSEETAKAQLGGDEMIQRKWLWIIDPLDGTKDFISGTGEYAVHIALVCDHSPVLGIVLLPEPGEMWIGVMGMGSWCEGRDGNIISFVFSNRRNLQDCILVSSRNHRNARLDNLIGKLNFSSSKSIGSVGCKVASILRGESDIYISLSGNSAPKDWDMAAPEVVLRAAGGGFTHADGSNLIYNSGDIRQIGCLVATNGNDHENICKSIYDTLKIVDK